MLGLIDLGSGCRVLGVGFTSGRTPLLRTLRVRLLGGSSQHLESRGNVT